MRPDDEAERANRDDGPDHHAVAENILAGVRAQTVRDDTESRKRDDINFRVTEEPEQMLEQDRAAAFVSSARPSTSCRHEETRAEVRSSSHHDGADNRARESEQAENGRDENAPDRQWHAHQRHALAARLQHGRDVVQPAHRERDNEYGQRHEHQKMPQSMPGVPSEMACGGYSVQPAPVGPPGTKKLAIRMMTTAGKPNSSACSGTGTPCPVRRPSAESDSCRSRPETGASAGRRP